MKEVDELQQAISTLEAQRALLGNDVVEIAVAPLREKLQRLQAEEPPAPDRQRKQISVLFADVSGFTAMSETMDPEEVSVLMNALWQDLDQVIIDHEGIIDKHIGDEVMALFGTPVAREDDPERAVRAALRLHQALEKFAENWRARNESEISLKMRVGINTGLTLLGTVGTTTEFTALGDTVNLASRLVSAAPVGGVLISHDTYQHVRGIFEVNMLEPLSVKGKAEPVQVYLVTSTRPRSFRVPTRGVVGIETKSIGRDAEFDQLKGVFREVVDPEDPKVRIVSIVGDAGLGKSRLLYEFSNWMDVQGQHLSLFRARVTEGSQAATPYSLIRALCAFRFEIQDTDSVETVHRKLLAGFQGLLDASQVNADEVAFIGSLAGFDFSDSDALRGIQDDPQQIQARAYHYLTRYFKRIMEQQPLVLLLEDMHWVDDRSIDFLEHLISECRGLALLVVIVCRPSFFNRHPSWGRDDERYQKLRIHPLDDEHSQLLVNEILRHTLGVPSELEDLIVKRAEGNPFYIEEVIKMLIQDGVIITAEPHWNVQLDKLSSTKIPSSLTGVIQARLDRLLPEERVALQRASVIGRVFWDHLVLCLDEGQAPLDVTNTVFSRLVGNELIFPRGASSFFGMDEFIFKNALLLEVTYESVLKQYRRIYHAQVADWLLEHTDRIAEFAGRIAEHFEVSEKHQQAAYWYARAGKQAQKTYALNAAIQYFRKALDHWEQVDDESIVQTMERIDIWQGLGAALSDLARYDEATAAYQKTLELAKIVGDEKRQAQSLNRLVNVLGRQGDLAGASELVQQAEAIASKGGHESELVEAFYARGAIAFYSGERDSLELVEKALTLSRKLGDLAQETRCLNLLAGVHFSAGRFEDSERFCNKALELTKQLGDRYLEMNLHNNLGQLAEARGDFELALSRYRAAIQSSQELGIRDSEIHFLSNLGGVQVRTEKYEEAEKNLRQAIQIADINRSLFLPETYRYLSSALLGQHKPDEALIAVRKALKLARESGIQEQASAAWRVLGEIAFLKNDAVPVEDEEGKTIDKNTIDCFNESIAICDEYGLLSEHAETLEAWAETEFKKGNSRKGQELWDEARERFASLGSTHEIERMDRSLKQ